MLVCGGRDYDDEAHVFATLDMLHRAEMIGTVIEGGAKGADTLAARWGYSRMVHVHTVEADWKRYGQFAGPIRNQRMIKMRPALVVAFPGGRGTADMVRRAEHAAIPVFRSSPESAVASEEGGR